MVLLYLVAALTVFLAYKLAKVLYRRLRRHSATSDYFVFVVGCDSGFGYSCCWYLHRAGCTVLAGCLRPDGTAADQLRGAGIPVVTLDVTSPDSVSLATENVAKLCGRAGLSAVIYNAGVLTMGRLHWLQPDHISSMINVNLLGAIEVARAMMPLLARTKGRFVMISSPCSYLPCQELAVYAATKSAVNTLAMALRCDWKEKCIDVVLLTPGDIMGYSNILSQQNQKMRAMWDSMSSSQRLNERACFEAFRSRFTGIRAQTPSVINTSRLRRAVLSAVLDKKPLVSYTAVELGTLLIFLLQKVMPQEAFEFLLRYHLHFLLHRLDSEWLDFNNIF